MNITVSFEGHPSSGRCSWQLGASRASPAPRRHCDHLSQGLLHPSTGCTGSPSESRRASGSSVEFIGGISPSSADKILRRVLTKRGAALVKLTAPLAEEARGHGMPVFGVVARASPVRRRPGKRVLRPGNPGAGPQEVRLLRDYVVHRRVRRRQSVAAQHGGRIRQIAGARGGQHVRGGAVGQRAAVRLAITRVASSATGYSNTAVALTLSSLPVLTSRLRPIPCLGRKPAGRRAKVGTR